MFGLWTSKQSAIYTLKILRYKYHVHTSGSSTSSSVQSKSSGTPYPLTHYVNCNAFSAQHRKFLAAVTSGFKPQTFNEAMKDEKWRNAIQKEIQALEDNGTWIVTTLPVIKEKGYRKQVGL